MEEKGGMSPSGVNTVKGEEALVSRTEFQQNPSFLQFVGPTTVVSPSPPPPPPPPSQPQATPQTQPLTTVTPPGSTAGTGSDPTKKKRGRPRKYAPDGSLNPRASRPTLSPTPISSSIPFSGDYHHHSSNWKRGKADQYHHQPREYLQKSHKFEYESPAPPPVPVPAPGLSCYVGANFTTHQFTVNAGEDVTMKVMPYSQQGSRAICILSATGSISNVTLRQPTISGGTLTYEGRFEILSLTGSFMPTENGGTRGRSGGMSISLAGPNGKIIGGGLAGMLIAAAPVQVIMGSFIVMHQAEQNQRKKPRIMDTYASPPPQPQQQQQPPTFTITTVNSTSPVVATVEEPKQQIYGGVIARPMAQMPSSFHNENPAMNNFTTTYHGYGNMNSGANKVQDGDEDDGGGDDDSGDTRSISHSG